MRLIPFLPACALGLVLLPMPAAAEQAEPPQRTINLVVYGDDACPQSTDDEIVVCARRPEEERYRLRTVEPVPGERTEQGGTARTLGTDDVRLAGGTGSCTTVGPGGLTGCTKGIDLLGLGAWLNSLVTDQ